MLCTAIIPTKRRCFITLPVYYKWRFPKMGGTPNGWLRKIPSRNGWVGGTPFLGNPGNPPNVYEIIPESKQTVGSIPFEMFSHWVSWTSHADLVAPFRGTQKTSKSANVQQQGLAEQLVVAWNTHILWASIHGDSKKDAWFHGISPKMKNRW